MSHTELLDEARKLSAEERAALIEALLDTLEPTDPDIDAAWAAESEGRIDAYLRGELQAVSHVDFLARRKK